MSGESIFVYVNDTAQENVKDVCFIRNRKTEKFRFDVSCNETEENAVKNLEGIKELIDKGKGKYKVVNLVFCNEKSQIDFLYVYISKYGYDYKDIYCGTSFLYVREMVDFVDYRLHRFRDHYKQEEEDILHEALYKYYRTFYGSKFFKETDDMIINFTIDFYPILLAESQRKFDINEFQ